ncbi:regulatory protein TetR [Actinobacteria bacterium OK074]|nr:regulatory protein TetR [Actinobacteria bacterium OK074]
MTATTRATTTRAARGRIDKRQAILDAAFAVFARRGYDQACVKEIADEAKVAKPTVYNHLNDKETLFRHALRTAADAVLAENLAVLERLRDPALCDPEPRAATDDLRAVLTDVGERLLKVCGGDRSRSLRWLTYSQVGGFPDLVEDVHSRTADRLAEALADRLARLALAGRLRPCEPLLAAQQLLALLTGPLETRTHLGTRKVSAAEVRVVAEAAVDTFLRAYGG